MSKFDKTYSNNEITVFWKPDLCIHCGNCAKSLPSVFKPREKPWITIEGAPTSDIIITINGCPSNALSFRSDKY
jgi:uncharacterized Fe-S cluster protein YjdI